jgi:hypothetical protein
MGESPFSAHFRLEEPLRARDDVIVTSLLDVSLYGPLRVSAGDSGVGGRSRGLGPPPMSTDLLRTSGDPPENAPPPGAPSRESRLCCMERRSLVLTSACPGSARGFSAGDRTKYLLPLMRPSKRAGDLSP